MSIGRVMLDNGSEYDPPRTACVDDEYHKVITALANDEPRVRAAITDARAAMYAVIDPTADIETLRRVARHWLGRYGHDYRGVPQ